MNDTKLLEFLNSSNISNLNITNITNITNSENTNGIQLEIFIGFMIILGLIGLLVLIGFQDCAVNYNYHNFIQCLICEFSIILLSCFVGQERCIIILNNFSNRNSNTRNIQISYSDTDSEYSNDGNHKDNTIINVEPAIFIIESPKLYIEDEDNRKICSICCEELYKNNITNNDTSYIEETEKEKINVNEINNIVKLGCGHLYHSDCIQKWYNQSKYKDCPNCKKEINVEEYYFT